MNECLSIINFIQNKINLDKNNNVCIQTNIIYGTINYVHTYHIRKL